MPGIRLLDPHVVSPDVQAAAGRSSSYYEFPDILDVDRYTVDGESRDTVIAVRELDLDGVPAGQRNWINDHTVYTHGFGVVAAYGNRKDADGQPVFFEQGIPLDRAASASTSRASTSASSRRTTRSSGRPRAPRRGSSTTPRQHAGRAGQQHVRRRRAASPIGNLAGQGCPTP